MPNVRPPKEMPGERGLVNGVRHMMGSVRNGMAHINGEHARYGELYQVQFLHSSMVAVWDADLIHEIIQNNDQLWSTARGWNAIMFEGLDPRAGNTGTLLTLDFDEHKAARKLVQPAFTLKAIDGYLGIARRGFYAVLPGWVERGRVDFKPAVRKLLATVATEIFTGLRDPEQVDRVDTALEQFWKGIIALSRRPWLSPTYRRSQRGLATLLHTFLALVPEKRKSGGLDLFSRMCQGGDPDGLGDEAMVRVFITIMFGAFDTTSAALTSMAYLLAKHPGWQERLRQECLGVPGDDLDASSMKSLRQVEWAWKETLRLMPVTSFVPRVPVRDTELGGYPLRAGTLVAPMVGGIGQHPRWWKEPTRFDPERFSPERAEDKQHPSIYLPFGAGAHACVGMQLANMEVKLFWHELLTRCVFTLEKDHDAHHAHGPMGTATGKVALTLRAL